MIRRVLSGLATLRGLAALCLLAAWFLVVPIAAQVEVIQAVKNAVIHATSHYILGTADTSGIRLKANALGDLAVQEGDDSAAANLANDVDVRAGTGTAPAGLGGVLTISTASAQTTAVTTEEDLWTYTLPANTLSANNYGVYCRIWYRTAANANSKAVRVYWGGTALDTYTAASNDQIVVIDVEVWRTGASAQRTFYELEAPSAGARNTTATHTKDDTAAQIIKFTGQNGVASAGDIVFLKAHVSFLRAGS